MNLIEKILFANDVFHSFSHIYKSYSLFPFPGNKYLKLKQAKHLRRKNVFI